MSQRNTDQYNGDASFDDSLSSHAEYTNVPAIMTLEVTEVQGHVFGCAGAFPRDGADQNLVGPPAQACGAGTAFDLWRWQRR